MPLRILDVDVPTRLDEEVCNIWYLALNGEVQGGPPLSILCVDVGTIFDEELCNTSNPPPIAQCKAVCPTAVCVLMSAPCMVRRFAISALNDS